MAYFCNRSSSYHIKWRSKAYNAGRLNSLREYVQTNKEVVVDFLVEKAPELSVVSLEATYLLWIDCRAITADSEELADYLRKRTGLYLTAGTEYGSAGKQFLRMNVACTRACLQDGLNRLKEGIDKYQFHMEKKVYRKKN